MAVVEFLTFEVAQHERDQWLDVEERVWSRFLEAQPGFVSKQMWAPRDSPGLVHAVITWESEALWKAITMEQVAIVDAQMGEWFRPAICHVFDLVREC